ncbi:MAG: divergent polysaccharide deacetylase family protein [Treponema sp.]|nr:divergent polysaccharide deacetylase family protein [Treponema sp.]
MQKKSRSSASKKAAPKKRRARKAKVALDQKKLMILCAAVCFFCVLLLAVTAFFSRGTDAPKKEQKPAPEKIVKNEKPAPATVREIDQETPEPKKEKASKNKDNKKQKKETPSKKEPGKKEEPAVAPTKQEPQPEVVAPAKQESQGFGFVPAKNGAVLCVVFDDGGQRIDQLKKCLALPFPVTVAVMPKLAHSAQSAALVRQSKNEVILHQPMQSVNLNVNPGPGAITPDMSAGEIEATLAQNIAEIAPISGMNNHEGSLITADEGKVSFILETARQNGIYFLDSRTNSATKIPDVAKQMDMGWYQRDIFLDNQKTRENYLAELKKGLEIANKKGHVIMIGHVWSADTLPAFLEEAYPELALKGYRFATVSKSGGMMR